MFGAISRLFWNSSNRFRPYTASRRMRMLHHSPTRSRLRATGHCMLPKFLRCMEGRIGQSLSLCKLLHGVAGAAPDALRRPGSGGSGAQGALAAAPPIPPPPLWHNFGPRRGAAFEIHRSPGSPHPASLPGCGAAPVGADAALGGAERLGAGDAWGGYGCRLSDATQRELEPSDSDGGSIANCGSRADSQDDCAKWPIKDAAARATRCSSRDDGEVRARWTARDAS